MRQTMPLFTLAVTMLTAFVLAVTVFVTPNFALAEQPHALRPACDCPKTRKSSQQKFADIHGPLDDSDELAALASVQMGLSQAGDGTTFVWRRGNGRLSGTVSPTSSFRNRDGAICRHLIVLLTTGFKTKKTEGIACRLPNGRWQLDG
jgi:hypothetical protein